MITSIYSLPLWLSFATTIAGIVLSLLLVRYAYKSLMFTFTIFLTVGILIFSVHHILDLTLKPVAVISESFEVLSSLIFFMAAVYLGLALRKII